jgi:hypothetical protein
MSELLDLVQSLGLGAVLAITVLQLVRYNRQLKAETYLTVVQLYFELQGRHVDHPEINAEPDRPFMAADLGTPRAFLVDQDLTLTETIYLMFKKYRFVDPDLWNAWQAYLMQRVSSTFVQTYWEARKELYSETFRGLLDGLLARAKSATIPP